MEILLIRLIESLIMPPGLMLVMMLLGTFIIGHFYRTGKILIIGGFALLLASSLPIVPKTMLRMLEQTSPVNPAQLQQQQIQAIVVLGGGRYANAPEYNGKDTVSKHTLERLRYAAHLHRRTGIPVLVTGGNPYGHPVAEAKLMQGVLKNEFGTPVKWVEDHSANTWENARFSHAMLDKAGVQRIALVTHAWHMPRSVTAFEQMRFKVIPAPMGFSTSSHPLILDFFPSAGAMDNTRMAMHEIIGRIWYAIRY